MTLQDLENECLLALQSPLVNFGGAPNWASLQGPQLSQAMVDHAINRGYVRLATDLADLELLTQTITFASVSQTYKYAIPAAPLAQPAIQMVRRVFYLPLGMQSNLELEPGGRLVSWSEFQRASGAGWLNPFSFAMYPEVCAVSPDRKMLWFYPGPIQTGDTITVAYAPTPTAGTTVPTLVNPTDALLLPDDCSTGVVEWALSMLWPKYREFGAVAQCREKYAEEVARLRQAFARSSTGDKLRIVSRGEMVATSGYLAGRVG